jgi:hypothetical protein
MDLSYCSRWYIVDGWRMDDRSFFRAEYPRSRDTLSKLTHFVRSFCSCIPSATVVPSICRWMLIHPARSAASFPSLRAFPRYALQPSPSPPLNLLTVDGFRATLG